MEIQEIEVTIGKDGKVQLQVRGVHGTKCLELTRELEEALGGDILSRIMTPEALEDGKPIIGEETQSDTDQQIQPGS